MLLSKEADPIDHLLCTLTSRSQALGQSGILPLEKLHSLGGDYALRSRGFQALEPSFRLQSAASEGCQLLTEVLYQLLELRKCRSFRTYAV